MQIEKCRDVATMKTVVAITFTDEELARVRVPIDVREWYNASRHSVADELFYLSEIVKGLENKGVPKEPV